MNGVNLTPFVGNTHFGITPGQSAITLKFVCLEDNRSLSPWVSLKSTTKFWKTKISRQKINKFILDVEIYKIFLAIGCWYLECYTWGTLATPLIHVFFEWFQPISSDFKWFIKYSYNLHNSDNIIYITHTLKLIFKAYI